MTRVSRVTGSYALCHFVVDFACVPTMLGTVAASPAVEGAGGRALAILVYDLFAFCLQLPVGALLDVLGRRASARAALASFALVASGVSCGWAGGAAALAAVPLVALGNALFHCVGGIEVLGESQGRMAPAGEFISTGALGVFLGGRGKVSGWRWTPPLLLALLAACAGLALVAPTRREAGCLRPALTRRGLAAAALLAATVALRSYVGMVMAFPWKANLALATLSVVAVVAGKAAGGRVADVLGAPLASALSLCGAALLFVPAWTSVPAGLVATFLFNFTMAITLSSLAELLPEAQGLAFGIASFALALGALPALFGVRVASGAALAALSLASFVLLEAGLALLDRGDARRGARQTEVRVRPPRTGRRP